MSKTLASLCVCSIEKSRIGDIKLFMFLAKNEFEFSRKINM
jgi:hypothetical protein